MTSIVANCRTLAAPLTGVQRYTIEILRRAGNTIGRIEPVTATLGLRGHAWDQALAWRLPRDTLLWSPANVGPLGVAAQVLTVHDVAALDHPEWLSRAFGAWYRWLTPRLVRRVRAVVTVSEFSKQRLLAHVPIPPHKVHVVPNGVDSRFAPQSHDTLRASQHRFGLPSPRYVLAVGSLEPRKNLGTLFRAWIDILPELPEDLWLVVAGLKGAAHIHGDAGLPPELPPRVWLPGHVAEDMLPSLYAGAQCFVYTSIYEGFGLPPLEAMASGVAVVSSNTTSIPEVVGDAGLLIDPQSVPAIGSAILQLVRDDGLRGRLAQAGLARSGQFSWNRCADETVRLLQHYAGSS